MTRRTVLAWAVWLACGTGLALAADGGGSEGCVPVAGGAELTVEGLGRAVFAGLSTDRVRDEALLSGGVCVEFSAIGGVLRSERLTISGLGDGVALAAADVVFELDAWTIAAELLEADEDGAVLVGVGLQSPEAVALAAGVRVDLVSGTIAAHDLRLATATLWVVADEATLDGERVALQRVALTTCDCAPAEASVRLEARAAELDLVVPEVTLHGAELVVGALRWALRDPWSFDAANLALPLPPIAVFEDPDGRRGTLVGVTEQPVAPGVRLAWDVGLGDDARPPDASLRLTARAADADGGEARVDVVGASDRMRVAWRVARPLAEGWALAYAQRLEGGAWDEPVRDQHVSVGRTRAWPTPVAGVAEAAVDAEAFVALTAQTLAGDELVGTRLGGSWRLRLGGEPAGGWRPDLEVAAGATAYPAGGGPQAWVSVAPRATLTTGGLRLDLGHLSRWVWGASPFGASLDRLATVHRSDLGGSWAPAVGEARVTLAARWDWRPDADRPGRAVGLERLDLSASTSGAAWSGRLSVRVDAALAGVVDPRPGRTASVGGVVTWARDDWELGARVRVDPAAPAWPWSEATVFAAAPVTTGDWSWRPYLAVDLASWARGQARWWVGHGLELAWRSDFGVLDLGYRYDDGIGLRLDVGVRFESRPLELERLAATRQERP